MDLDTANDAILELIKKGCSTQDLLRIAAHYRRMELEQSLYPALNKQVVNGPFEGLKHTGKAFSSVLLPKLLGSYESEIYGELIKLAEESNCFLDIGCADGFYVAGIAFATPIKVAIGVDVDTEAIRHAEACANLNGLMHKCRFTTNLKESLDWINSKTLVMIDVDGAELEVIDNVCLNIKQDVLESSTFLIETDKTTQGLSNRDNIVSKLHEHGLQVTKEIKQSVVNRFPEIIASDFLDQCILGLEGRNAHQSWLIASKAPKRTPYDQNQTQ